MNTQVSPSDDWSGAAGRRWLAQLDRFEAMIAPIGEALLARADVRPGERVIDLGCGGGATTRALAPAVGPDGAVLGLDISPDLIAEAQARSTGIGAQLSYLCADAATASIPGAPYDRIVSRFGSMFFADPVAAFAHLATALRDDGRIDLAVWGPPRDNGWMMTVMNVVRAHVEVPPAIPRAPGPFAFEDRDYLSELLTAAGYREIDFAEWRGLLAIGGPGLSPEAAAGFALASLSAANALGDAGEDTRAAATTDLTRAFAAHHDAAGGVLLPARVWLVSARR